MTINPFLLTDKFPYCKGCGHHFIAQNIATALEKLGFHPKDVVLVTDTGCHGIVDRCFATHTVHGLHGRSVALGGGISFGLSDFPRDKKVVVFIGDGGATIGLQHLMEAARLNINMTVIVHDNMLYGMTGGQSSGLTPRGFRTTITPQGNPVQGYDIPRLVHAAGAAYAARIAAKGDFSDIIAKALKIKGFALIEAVGICTGYGTKYNPGTIPWKLLDTPVEYENPRDDDPAELILRGNRKRLDSLFDVLRSVETKYSHNLSGRFSLILGGSAGGGVQAAAAIFAQAGMSAGLNATKKGSYPVTVGVGFSNAEVILSPEPILFNGIEHPDTVIILTSDGLEYNRKRLASMHGGTVYIDSSLETPETNAEIITHDFRKYGERSAALYSLVFFLHRSRIFPVEALVEAINSSKLAGKVPIEKMTANLS